MQKVYVIAKISGLDYNQVKANYEAARETLLFYGFEAVIPTDHIPATATWHEAMRQAIPLLLGCDFYTNIDPTHTTAGGMIEETIAIWTGVPKLNLTTA